MSTTSHQPAGSTVPTGWYRSSDCDLDDFRTVVEQTTEPGEYPHAEEVVQNVLVYGDGIGEATSDDVRRREVQAELARALQSGPGIVVFRGAVDGEVVDRATEAFAGLIAEQRRSGSAAGDQFAKAAANDRA
jgi:hypothetical protein